MQALKVIKRQTPADRRRELRDSLWPNAASEVWNRKNEIGFTTIPRTLTLLMTLIDELTKGKDASRVYCDLWCRTFDEGFVDIMDEELMGFASGYVTPSRGVRSWKERIAVLEELGFISLAPKGPRKYGYILLRHPHVVVQKLRAKKAVSEAWWGAFMKRISEIGTKMPTV